MSVNTSHDMNQNNTALSPNTKAGTVEMHKNKSAIFEVKMNDLQLSHTPRGWSHDMIGLYGPELVRSTVAW